jgi:hypothetical protein
MAEKKIIAVVGATGAQGGGMVRAILNDPKSDFTVRALTRDVSSDKAKALAKLGAQVVKADIDDLESLKSASKAPTGRSASRSFGRTLRRRKSWPRPRHWPRQQSTPGCSTPFGLRSKIPASGSL